ncbi:hypothetical protein HanPI659440_Chr14g0528531 [Helianthus annuus]|nr:hypothetical protein HanPI659440_Chr14g0528531 [Helianthus annuus]
MIDDDVYLFKPNKLKNIYNLCYPVIYSIPRDSLMRDYKHRLYQQTSDGFLI